MAENVNEANEDILKDDNNNKAINKENEAIVLCMGLMADEALNNKAVNNDGLAKDNVCMAMTKMANVNNTETIIKMDTATKV